MLNIQYSLKKFTLNGYNFKSNKILYIIYLTLISKFFTFILVIKNIYLRREKSYVKNI